MVGEGAASFHPWRRRCLQEWRERVFRLVKREIREIIKKSEENDYLNKIDGRIDKLMWELWIGGYVK